ncbi:hypothetical protein BSKO_10731 [Bryopsis sp. KO-2023]|nr:hypothetical protein BSKO_10731 [Bryopsis sp. KO-2023]
MNRESKNLLDDRYEFLGELGKGSFGSVYLAKDHKTGESAAIKALSVNCSTRRAIYEIRNHHMLEHPNIIRLREVLVKEGPTHTEEDVLCSGDRAYLVMDFASRGTLRQEIYRKNGILSEEDARGLFRQLMSAVAYCHEKDVVSRDIKLSNVLLDDPEPPTDGHAVVKLCDFGFSKNLATDSSPKSMIGTPDYVAPEVLKGGTYSKEVDIWSCGVVLYMMVTGFKPFSGVAISVSSPPQKTGALLKTILSGVYAYPEGREVSKECENLISKCLVLNPEERLTAAQVLAHPWVASK